MAGIEIHDHTPEFFETLAELKARAPMPVYLPDPWPPTAGWEKYELVVVPSIALYIVTSVPIDGGLLVVTGQLHSTTFQTYESEVFIELANGMAGYTSEPSQGRTRVRIDVNEIPTLVVALDSIGYSLASLIEIASTVVRA